MVKIQKLYHGLYTYLSRLSKREKYILYVATFFILLVTLDRLIINQVLSRIEALDREIEGRKIAIRRNLGILAQKDRILAEGAKYASFASSLATEEEMTLFLKEIGSLADKNSVYLVDMKPRGVKDIDSSKKYSISLSCEAQMEQLAKFMYDVENLNKPLTIESYQLSPKSKKSSVAICNIVISKIVMP